MRNFILFLRRFSNPILFLIIETICVVLIARTNTIQGNDIMSSANVVLANMYQKGSDVEYYFGLRRMNDSLLLENRELRNRLASYQYKDTFLDRNVVLTQTSQDSTTVVRSASYTYYQGKVINNSIHAANNYITINRGASDGIKKGMAVISGNGIVGKVVHTSEHFASILSVLSKQQVSAKLKDGTYGHTVWEISNPDELLLKDIPQQIAVKKGDSVYTTNYSFFPPDVLIGVVTKTEHIQQNNLQLIHLKPVTNFRNLQYVYVIDDHLVKEKETLEQEAAKENE